MVSPELIWLAGALAVMGIALLRMSWGRPGRAAGLNALGWAALAIGVVIGGALAGAWGDRGHVAVRGRDGDSDPREGGVRTPAPPATRAAAA